MTTAGDANSLVEIPVPTEMLRAGENTVEISVAGDRGSRMAFAALRVSQSPKLWQ
ncbi:MAG: hypothetical protein HC888_04510 [Candidatus Competibacteraceae bacterium]|nr:hypothetical protein [Candidatus Competibacteraceae bacterium]